MTLLIERASATHAHLVDRNRKQAGAQLAQRLAAVGARAQRSMERLRVGLSGVDALAALGVSVGGPNAKLVAATKKACTNLRTSATRLEAAELDDAAALKILDGTAFQEGLGTVEKAVEDVAARLARSLEEDRKRLCPPNIGDPIPDVPGLAGVVTRLEIQQQRLRAPVTVSADSLTEAGWAWALKERELRVEATAVWAKEYPDLVAALEKESPEFRDFLLAASGVGGAPLKLLTPAVLERLERDNLVDDFRVTRG